MKKITNNMDGETTWTRWKDTQKLLQGLEVMNSRRVRGEQIIKQGEEKL